MFFKEKLVFKITEKHINFIIKVVNITYMLRFKSSKYDKTVWQADQNVSHYSLENLHTPLDVHGS